MAAGIDQRTTIHGLVVEPPTSRIKKLKRHLDVGHRVFSLFSVEALGVDSVEQNGDVTSGMFWSY